MSFWKKAGDLALKTGGAVLGEIKAAGERTEQYKEEMPSKNDESLFKIIEKERAGSPLKASAAMQELKSRGYSSEEIKEKISTK